jgi:PAS domain S-box-containing protein
MKLPSRDSLVRTTIAVSVVAAVAVLRLLLWSFLEDEAPYLFYWPVVVFAAWYAGPAAGVLVTVLSALAVNYFFHEPYGQFTVPTSAQAVGHGGFIILGAGVSLFIGRLHTTAQRAQGQARLSSSRRARLEQILRAEREALARAVREVEKRRLAEEALRQSEEQYRLLAETVPQIVWVARPDGHVEYFNSRWAEYTGAVPEATLGWGWQEVVHPDDRPAALAAWEHALHTGEPCEVEYRLRRHDGQYRWHIARALPVRDEDGEVVRWVGTGTDLHDQKTTQAELRQANERFRLAAEAVSAVIYDWDPESNTVTRTRGLFEMLGHRPEEAEPTNAWWRQQVHPDDRDRMTQHWQEALVQGDRFVLEYRLRHKDGHYLHVIDRGALVRDADGRLVRVVGSCQDITARVHVEQALRASEARLRFLADSGAALAATLDYGETLQAVARLAVPDLADFCVIHRVTEDGDIRQAASAHVDPARDRLLADQGPAYRPAANPRSRIAQVIRTGVPQLWADTAEGPARAALAHEGVARLAQVLAPRSWLVVPLVARGRTLGTVSLMMAESGRRYEPADLAQAEELARRAAVALDNARLYTEAREADRRKDEFLAMLGHELRNPLAPIISSLHLLRHAELDGAEAAAARGTIDRQVRHLTRLVDDLLDVARITRGKVKLQRHPVELAQVVETALEVNRPLYNARGHLLRVELPAAPVWLQADSARLTQVFGNLLTNAAKYMEDGGEVTFSAELAGAGHDGAGRGRAPPEVVVRVRDRGMGIPAEMLSRVFDLFTQVGSTLDRAQGGLGIGLSLVKTLVELHGGAVEAHSGGPGRGSTFTVRLPVLAAPPAAAAHAPPKAAAAENGRPAAAGCGVLVTDDNRDAADSLARLLKAWGHTVRVTYDGPTAITAARDFRPRVVLLDIGLGGMSGYEVAEQLRREPGLEAMRLIALTGFGQEEDRRRSQEAGFHHHLVKPVDPEELQRLLAEAADGVRGG